MSLKSLKFNLLLFLFVSGIVLTTSCVSRKQVTYFQPSKSQDSLQYTVKNVYVTKIQKGDILSIMVSSLSPEANAMFNPYQSMSSGNNVQQNQALIPENGYLIDETGSIRLPLIGDLKVAGLSTKEAVELITPKLDKYLQQPTVNIRILNFKISVLGEVNRPSIYTIPNEKITLPEAISLAGDLTLFGKRTNIMIIRESEGKREFAKVDLSKRDFFNSPYYYLHPNDVLYVEADKSKFQATDQARLALPLVVSGVSLIALLINLFSR